MPFPELFDIRVGNEFTAPGLFKSFADRCPRFVIEDCNGNFLGHCKDCNRESVLVFCGKRAGFGDCLFEQLCHREHDITCEPRCEDTLAITAAVAKQHDVCSMVL